MALRITTALREHMVKEFGLAADASEDQIRAAVIDNQITGKLALETIKSLTVDKAAGAVVELEARVSKIEATMAAGFGEIKQLLGAKPAAVDTGAAGAAPAGAKAGDVGAVATKAMASGASLGSGAEGGGRVDVLKAVERYSDTRTAATWDKSANAYMAKHFAGQPISQFMSGVGSGPIDMPTQRMLAISGAFFKHLANKGAKAEGREVPWQFRMTEHDRELVKFAVHESAFVGPIGYSGSGMKSLGDRGEDTDSAAQWCEGVRLRDLPNGDYWMKAVLDDSTSGGLEAVPVELDAMVIMNPLLNGELFPMVDVVTVSRRRQEGVKIGNPTMVWGSAEGTPIGLFDTDGFISAFDTTIHPITGALELGRDFTSDSPVAIGVVVQKSYGERFKAELDNAIANGNGTNRPEGLFVCAGVSTVTPATLDGAPAVGDYEGLQFAVPKQYLQEAGMPPNSRAVFVGSQQSYSRARGIPVDSANDARRVFDVATQMNYRLMDFRYAINESAGNTKIGFFCLNRYRLYRRAGLEVRVVRDDREGVLRNTELVAVRARFGGAFTTAAAGAKITRAQA